MAQGHGMVASDSIPACARVPVAKLTVCSDGVPACLKAPAGTSPGKRVVICCDVSWSPVGSLDLPEDCRDGQLPRLGSRSGLVLLTCFFFISLAGLEPSTMLKEGPASLPTVLFEATNDVDGDESKAYDAGDQQDSFLAIAIPVW